MPSSGGLSQRRLALLTIASFVGGSAQIWEIIAGEGGNSEVIATVCFTFAFAASAWQYFQNFRQPS